MDESQLGTEPTAVGRRQLSRFRQTYINYGRTNGRKPTWQHAAVRLIRRSAGMCYLPPLVARWGFYHG
jgi:hypothetical protein